MSFRLAQLKVLRTCAPRRDNRRRSEPKTTTPKTPKLASDFERAPATRQPQLPELDVSLVLAVPVPVVIVPASFVPTEPPESCAPPTATAPPVPNWPPTPFAPAVLGAPPVMEAAPPVGLFAPPVGARPPVAPIAIVPPVALLPPMDPVSPPVVATEPPVALVPPLDAVVPPVAANEPPVALAPPVEDSPPAADAPPVLVRPPVATPPEPPVPVAPHQEACRRSRPDWLGIDSVVPEPLPLFVVILYQSPSRSPGQ